jgi:PPOX class probable F420-dependent enzyme
MVAQTWTNQAAIAPDAVLRPFVRQRNVLLTTYRRDGTPKSTPVHIAVADGRAYFRTWETAWKMRRIRRNPDVTIAPSTARGVPTGPAISARARVLSGEEEATATRALTRKYPILHGVLIPCFHRLRGYRTVHCELMPTF